MTCRTPAFFLVAVLTCWAAPALAQSANPVAGEKQDSGLGSLPHFSKWTMSWARKTTPVAAARVEGESLDNQLGELPPYRLWLDRTGQDPMGTNTAASFRLASAKSGAKTSAVTVQASN